MTRVAVVDLGTNSTRLLVADIEAGRVHELERLLTITRLGEGVDAGKRLAPAAAARVEACVATYMASVDSLGADRTLAVATSAVRDAVNGPELLGRLEQRFGLPTRLLTGEEEAQLTFLGALAGRAVAQPTLVVDLGGGSTELVVGTNAGIDFYASLDIGCVRLTERYLAHDPRTAVEVAALESFVDGLLAQRVPATVRPGVAVGVAGTVTTLATLDLGLPREDTALLHGHRLRAAWIEQEAAQLAATPVEILRSRTGLHPERAPVIAAGALAVARILAFFELTQLEVSMNDILQGVALELAA